MLDKQITTTITDLVRRRPCTVQEIAALIDKNWRTAERYVDAISRETGHIATRTFRSGTRGALKVVYWNALESSKGSAYQERLLQRIEHGKRKEDFSPFELYQFVDAAMREAFLEAHEFSQTQAIKYDTLIGSAKRQLLLFSGNLSWLDLGPDMLRILEQLATNKVTIKILTRVDITSEEKTKAVLAINHRVGWDAVEVRHCEQPLRAVIIDDELATIKEVLTPEMHRELLRKKFLFYLIKDPAWINWLQKVFWHLWGRSIDAPIRLDALRTVMHVDEPRIAEKRKTLHVTRRTKTRSQPVGVRRRKKKSTSSSRRGDPRSP